MEPQESVTAGHCNWISFLGKFLLSFFNYTTPLYYLLTVSADSALSIHRNLHSLHFSFRKVQPTPPKTPTRSMIRRLELTEICNMLLQKRQNESCRYVFDPTLHHSMRGPGVLFQSSFDLPAPALRTGVVHRRKRHGQIDCRLKQNAWAWH